jgi:hypothetical protein
MPDQKRKGSRGTLADLTENARPLVKGIADTCRDVGIICGFLYATYEFLSRLTAAFL